MAAKPRLWRELEGLPAKALEEVEEFVTSLKKRKGKRHSPGRNGKGVAKKQLSAIRKWAGTDLNAGFGGREHDAILYRCGNVV